MAPGWRGFCPCRSYPDGVQRPSRVLGLYIAVVAVVIGACTAGHVKPTPPPNLAVTSTTTSTSLDYSTVVLAAVAGHRVVNVPIGPGKANLNGTVSGPNGPVGGAQVHIERVVDGNVGSADVTSQPDGTWSLPNILGGLYRIRAWRAPDLALTTPQVLFIAATDTKSVDLQMGSYGGTQVTAAIAPNPPIIGEPAALAVLVSADTVGPDGVVRSSPKTGFTVQLFGQGRWTVDGSLTQPADARGQARWTLTCQELGPQPLSVVLNSADVYPLNLPACAPVPTTTTTSTTVAPGGSTTTTGRGSKKTTTTT